MHVCLLHVREFLDKSSVSHQTGCRGWWVRFRAGTKQHAGVSHAEAWQEEQAAGFQPSHWLLSFQRALKSLKIHFMCLRPMVFPSEAHLIVIFFFISKQVPPEVCTLPFCVVNMNMEVEQTWGMWILVKLPVLAVCRFWVQVCRENSCLEVKKPVP